MTKKDYLAIGKAIRGALGPVDRTTDYETTAYSATVYMAEHIADVFAADNPHFDRARFLRFVETGKDSP